MQETCDESRVKREAQSKKSQSAVSTTERYFTLSVSSLNALEDIIRITKKSFR